jgi:hypothetical protein
MADFVPNGKSDQNVDMKIQLDSNTYKSIVNGTSKVADLVSWKSKVTRECGGSSETCVIV